MITLKNKLRKSWLAKFAKKVLRKKTRNVIFPGSKEYWQQRYLSNRTSGSGSYGRLATFKAEVINTFVADYKIKSIIEFGCGDGNQLESANYPEYIGYDVSKKAIEICKGKFIKDKSKQFYCLSENIKIDKAELSLSLDVIYHLIEDGIFQSYMCQLFTNSTKYVIIYSSNYDNHFIAHVKCRKFTNWIDNNISSQWVLKEFVKNKYPFDKKDPDNTSMSDFYIYERLTKI